MPEASSFVWSIVRTSRSVSSAIWAKQNAQSITGRTARGIRMILIGECVERDLGSPTCSRAKQSLSESAPTVRGGILHPSVIAEMNGRVSSANLLTLFESASHADCPILISRLRFGATQLGFDFCSLSHLRREQRLPSPF